jgi:7-carboxy-7-deazaguanine synthase
VIAQIEALAPCPLVEFTGGEPMLHARELLPLMQRLLNDEKTKYTLMMETSGERPLEQVPAVVHKIVDVKCPGSGSAFGSFRMSNLQTLTARDEVKFVLRDRRDYEFARDFIREHLAAKIADGTLGHILLSPAFLQQASPLRTADNMELDARDLVGWMLEDGLPARLSLQVHKFVWEPLKKGV